MGRTLGMHLASRLAEVGVKVRAINIGFQHQAGRKLGARSYVISCIWVTHLSMLPCRTGSQSLVSPGLCCLGCGGIKMNIWATQSGLG